MSRDKNKPPFLPSPDYEVGYGKPPRDKRFRKGSSGNPNGRPKGAFNRRYIGQEERLFDAFRKHAAREITVRDGSAEVSMTMIEAAVRTLLVKVVQGSARHIEIFFKFMALIEKNDRELHEQLQQAFIEYKVGGERELARRKRFGITHLPDLVPHPEDIEIDFEDGSITVNGPMTEKEKAEHDAALERLDQWYARRQRDLAFLEAESSGDPKLKAVVDELRRWVAAQYDQTRANLGK
ncbi:DUF5681 domain-containing protein [Antarcticimicrobium sediminis]|uniref:DUF5681 domain-containing protein n=1 Tax=Antarcticimicrobium sediminis TaxID=2546227 RepID=A0A4R5EMA0_9RHOB|nr:DUF5681 domain-containing protein [Antarcticimicrobium sediminis]TDE35637.1 hypothetical protein E1B25_16925 [Antarcticimicrobium sediminis]